MPTPPARRRRLPLLALLLALAGFGESLLAQKVVASQEIALDNDTRYELFSLGDGHTVLYRDEPGSVTLDAFGPNLEVAWSRDLNLDKARPKPIGAVVAEGVVNVFYTFRRDRELKLKLHRYSERGNLSDSLVVTELAGDFLTPNWTLAPSDNGEVAILWSQRDSDTYLFIGVEVSTGRVLYRRVVEVEFGPLVGKGVGEIYVDAVGTAYLWLQENNRRSRIEDHRVKLIQVRPDGTVTSVTVALPETLVYGLRIAADDLNGRVALAGYYAEDPDAAAGALLLSLPYSMQGQARVVKVPFREDLLAAMTQKNRTPTGIKDLEVLDVQYRRDGSAVLIGEQRKETLRTTGGRSGYFGGTLKTDYLYEDIVIAAVSPDGVDLWQEALPKKQFSQDDGGAYSGYLVADSEEALHLVYNDEVRSGGTVSEYTITGTGAIERHSLMNTEYQDLWLRHRAGVQVDADTVVIPSERRNRLRLVRVEF